MRRPLPALGLAVALTLAACAPVPPPWVTLPPDLIQGAGDPSRAAILEAAAAFGNPASLQGQPARAARAVAELEYLAVAIPYYPRWQNFAAGIGVSLQQARAEARAALGIPTDAAPQAVMDGLFNAARFLRASDQAGALAALAPPTFSLGGAETLARLGNLPALPDAGPATARAQAEMERLDTEGSNRSLGGQGGSGGARN